VHTGLTRKLAESERPADLQRYRADSRFFARGHIKLLELEPIVLEVPRIHPQQHACPVAAFGPAGSGMNAEEAVFHVLRPGKQPGKLDLLALTDQRIQIFFQLCQLLLVRLGLGQLEKFLKIHNLTVQFFHGFDDGFERAELRYDRFCRVRIVPETGLGHPFFKLLQFGFLRGQVKASPGSYPPGPTVLISLI
jgi:hypothetical protein